MWVNWKSNLRYLHGRCKKHCVCPLRSRCVRRVLAKYFRVPHLQSKGHSEVTDLLLIWTSLIDEADKSWQFFERPKFNACSIAILLFNFAWLMITLRYSHLTWHPFYCAAVANLYQCDVVLRCCLADTPCQMLPPYRQSACYFAT